VGGQVGGTPAPPGGEDGVLGSAGLIGIIVGVILLIILVVMVVLIFYFKNKMFLLRQQKEHAETMRNIALEERGNFFLNIPSVFRGLMYRYLFARNNIRSPDLRDCCKSM
jgi:hypothetical protein